MNYAVKMMKTNLKMKHPSNSRAWRRNLVAALVMARLANVALPPAFAVSPPPDGGYSNFTTAEGQDALFSLTTGDTNTAVGFSALHNTTTGSGNTAIGASALRTNVGGWNSVAVGSQALYGSTVSFNIAIGAYCMVGNSTGQYNASVGGMEFNTTGSNNTSIGWGSLDLNNVGHDNTATGSSALYNESAGNYNVANGSYALYSSTNTSYSTAVGYEALYSNTTGNTNTAIGELSLYKNTTGGNNTAIGASALYGNTGSTNIALGYGAGFFRTTGSNNIDIGNLGVATESNTIRLGNSGTQTNTYIAGIYGATAAGGIGVFVDSNGHLGTATSSARFKEAIKPMDKASESILSLKPVTFRYKHDLDPDAIPQFGLVAEDVERVNPDLVARDDNGKPYTVRYEAVNAMLLNEFLKERRKVEQQRKDFEAALAQQQKQIDALAESLQKVSAQFELSKPASKTVLNNQ